MPINNNKFWWAYLILAYWTFFGGPVRIKTINVPCWKHSVWELMY